MTKVFAFTIKGIGKGKTPEEAFEDFQDSVKLDDLDVGDVECEFLFEEDEEQSPTSELEAK